MEKRKKRWPLRNCVWELTLACPFHCAYCGSGGGTARKGELTGEACMRVVRSLKTLGCRRVSLIGGEVFLHPDWQKIASALHANGMRVCIITNGYRMTPEIVKGLLHAQIESVAVSVDGPKEAHDRFRQPGSFSEAIGTIETLAGAGIPASAISALRADNVPLLPQLFEILRKYPLYAWQLQACSPMGNARLNGLQVKFSAKEVMDFVRGTAPVSTFPIGIADNIGYCTPDDAVLRGGCFTGCSAGLTMVGIDSVGNVRGCESMYDARFIEGNVKDRPLEEIWTDENAFAYNRRFTPDKLTGACAECKYGGRCGGGCRSYNYFANNGKLYESPVCISGKNASAARMDRE